MLVRKTLALLAAAVMVTAQSIDSLSECSKNCYYSSRDKSSQCTGALQADMNCLCPNADFFNAIHDCVTKACAPDDAGIAVAAAQAFCATATLPAEVPPATSAAPGNPDAAAPPASTTAPETPAGETQPAASPLTSTEPSASVPTDAAATSATAPSTAATSTTENSESATSTGAGAIVPVATEGSSTSSASAPASTSKDSDKDDDEPGLSTGAKAGIGAGIGVGSLVLLVTLALVIFRKRSTPKDHIKIADPVAGGRHYASDPYNHNNFSGATSQGAGITIMTENELEMKSRRYEDMVPRQQPRNMV
ncbi:hypothetical protein QBC45DRAFT_57215 [Copromyces sp. CBS 386.78]|nr:hypothetical protein QBC45DRAFT_57215 [Copromyces sp. CBS 386.78]